MRSSICKTLSEMILVYSLHLSRRVTFDAEHDRRVWKIVRRQNNVVGIRIWRLASSCIERQAEDALSKLMTTEEDGTKLNADVPVLNIPDNATPKDRLTILAITDDKYCWSTKPITIDQTDVFPLD